MSSATDFRYGFHLRPDPATCRAVADVHRVLRAQYGIITAGLFMPHITIKGFFRSEATPPEMADRLSQALAGLRPFRAWHCGLASFSRTSLMIMWHQQPDGSLNSGFFEVQERAYSALGPLIHPDCEWTPRDPRGQSGPNPLRAHITLAMTDLPPGLHDEVQDFVSAGGPIGSESFLADTYHLVRYKADWAGKWWQTLCWDILHSWRIPT